MIHYHGTPINPNTACVAAVSGSHAFVSYIQPDQLGVVLDCAQSFALDNGAFSAWRTGSPVTDWRPYYEWVAELHLYPGFDFCIIPDVIDGDERANDALIAEWPWLHANRAIGAPVWHLHESLDRLNRLSLAWPRICLGSSGAFSQVGSPAWWNRMAEAMDVICNRAGLPSCKVHGLRMLDPGIFTRFPFASADSTNVARNIGIDQKWRGTYTPASKEARAVVLRDRIESFQSPTFWKRTAIQTGLFMESVE